MKKMLVFGVMAGALAIAGACWAYPSLLGPTGGANLPVAGVISDGKWSVALDFVNDQSDFREETVGDTTFVFPDQSNTISLRALYGITPNAEVGFVYNNQKQDFGDGDESSGNWGINAKYAWPNAISNTSFAVGAVYQNYSGFDTSLTQLYGVGTYMFTEGSATSPAVRGSLGLNWTQIDGGDESVDAVRPFLDVDVAFASGLNVTAEYQFKNNDIEDSALSSIVARYPLNKDKTLIGQVGLTNAFRGVAGTDDHNLVLGVNYLFGK